ncbi:Putative F-box/LRR-repeat protein At5g25860 [Linum perenne]
MYYYDVVVLSTHLVYTHLKALMVVSTLAVCSAVIGCRYGELESVIPDTVARWLGFGLAVVTLAWPIFVVGRTYKWIENNVNELGFMMKKNEQLNPNPIRTQEDEESYPITEQNPGSLLQNINFSILIETIMADDSASGGLAEDDKLKEKDSSNWTLQRLPNELVIKIVSGLPLKEAVRTSVISKRWINLWKSANLVMDFDYSNELKVTRDHSHIELDELEMAELWPQFKNWVSEVLNQHKASRTIKFRIAFMLTEKCDLKEDIDRWIEFAISKRVEFFDLAFTLDLMTSSLDHAFLQDYYNHINTLTGLSDIRSLRSLRLSYVHIQAYVLEHIIANCPLLEELSLNRLERVTTLRVVGSAHSPLPLKRLEVTMCYNVMFLQIDNAPHLVRFVYDDAKHPLKKLEVGSNCSSLVDLTLSCYETFKLVSRYANQLRFLSLDLSYMIDPVFGLIEHPRLEQLSIKATGHDNESFVVFISLINQCPRLHTLQVNFWTLYEQDPRVMANVDKREQDSIKLVEIVEFTGCFREREIVEYAMQYFLGLEKIRIVMDRERRTEEQAYFAERVALELKSKASPAVEFTII